MADDEDQSSKTEEPTANKLRKLREDGQVPTSREVNHFFAVIGMLAIVGGAVSWAGLQLMQLGGAILQNAGDIQLTDGPAVGAILSHVLVTLSTTVLPLLAAMLVLGYASGWVQSGGLFSTKPLELNLNKISPLAGFKRLFGLKSLAELLKSALKMVIIGGALLWVMWQQRSTIIGLVNTDPVQLLHALQILLLWLVGTALVIMALLAAADYLFQRLQFMAENRMSFRELKDEMRDTEGDPHIKQRQRQIRQERAAKRMMSNVPKADVVITNPTHFACALRYKPNEGDAAPTLIAKGADLIALRIRELATQHNIPLVEDPPLARELYRSVELDQPIPITLYEVVAKVMALVMNLKNGQPRPQPTPDLT